MYVYLICIHIRAYGFIYTHKYKLPEEHRYTKHISAPTIYLYSNTCCIEMYSGYVQTLPVEKKELKLLWREDIRFEGREHLHWPLVLRVKYCKTCHVLML